MGVTYYFAFVHQLLRDSFLGLFWTDPRSPQSPLALPLTEEEKEKKIVVTSNQNNPSKYEFTSADEERVCF